MIWNDHGKEKWTRDLWDIRSLHSTGALGLVTSEIGKYRMDLVGVQEVRCEDSGTLESNNYTLFYGEGNANHQVGTGFLFISELDQQLKKGGVYQ
jgi:hypothetical protein